MHLWGSSEAPAGGAGRFAPKDSKWRTSQHEGSDAGGSALALEREALRQTKRLVRDRAAGPGAARLEPLLVRQGRVHIARRSG